MKHRIAIVIGALICVACRGDRITAAHVPSPATPILFVDGKEMPSEQLSQLNAVDVATIEVFKGAAALRLYGEHGRNGAIVITTKTAR